MRPACISVTYNYCFIMLHAAETASFSLNPCFPLLPGQTECDASLSCW